MSAMKLRMETTRGRLAPLDRVLTITQSDHFTALRSTLRQFGMPKITQREHVNLGLGLAGENVKASLARARQTTLSC